MWQRHRLLLHIVCIVSVLLVLSVVFFVKVFYYAKVETTRGDQAFQRQAYQEAITHYERAIKWYLPYSQSVRDAVERLWEIGVMAEKRHDLTLALAAYRSLRGSLYAVQSFHLPYPQRIAEIEAKIALLMAKVVHPAGRQVEPQGFEQDHNRYTAMLQRKTVPDAGGIILTEIGFLGWIGATIGLIWYALGENGKWIWKRCLLWGSTIAIFFAVWIIGMLLV